MANNTLQDIHILESLLFVQIYYKHLRRTAVYTHKHGTFNYTLSCTQIQIIKSPRRTEILHSCTSLTLKLKFELQSQSLF